MTRPGCGYCGLPRARVRLAAGQVVTLPVCLPHVDLLELDPFYRFDGAIAEELRADELATSSSALASSSTTSRGVTLMTT